MGDGLQVSEDRDFQRREWQVVRVGWVLIPLFLLLAALGLLGPGWLSSTTLTAGDGELRVRVERVGHRFSETDMTITVAAEQARQGQFLVDIDRELALALEIQEITPSPAVVEVVDGAFRYTFPQRQARADLHVRIGYRPVELWRQNGTVSIPGGPSVDIHTFTFL